MPFLKLTAISFTFILHLPFPTNKFGIEPGTLFAIQFFWQFPHFWAIGWFLYDDYKKAGFFMLPTGKRDKGTAVQTLIYTIWTVLSSLIPALGITGTFYITPLTTVLVVILGVGFIYYAVQLFQKMSTKAARALMLASVIYITLLQILYVLDKFLR